MTSVKILWRKDNDNPTDLSPYSNHEESETMIEPSEKEELREIKTMKTKNIDATRINVTQICYYFIEKKVSLNKIILLRCKLVIGFSFFLVHFLTQKVWAEKICIHFHA